jgi:hypothetical protein
MGAGPVRLPRLTATSAEEPPRSVNLLLDVESAQPPPLATFACGIVRASMARGATGFGGGLTGTATLVELLGRASLLNAVRSAPVPAESLTAVALGAAALNTGFTLTLVSTADDAARRGALLAVSGAALDARDTGAAARSLLKSHTETSAPSAKAKMVKSTGFNGERARRACAE